MSAEQTARVLLRVEADAEQERIDEERRLALEADAALRRKRDAERESNRLADAAAVALLLLAGRTARIAADKGRELGLAEARAAGVSPWLLRAAQSGVMTVGTEQLERAARAYREALAARAKYLTGQRATSPFARALAETQGRALRVISTETWTAGNEQLGRMQREAGRVDASLVRVWVAEMDRRTCDRCALRDGRTVAAALSFDSEPPLHPLCRCTTELRRRST